MKKRKQKANRWIEEDFEGAPLDAIQKRLAVLGFVVGYEQGRFDTLQEHVSKAFRSFDKEFSRRYDLEDRGKKK